MLVRFGLRTVGTVAFAACLLIACSNSGDRPASNMAAARAEKDRRADLRAAMKRVEPFFSPMGKPEPNDWLAVHTESGQTFEQYLDSKPTTPTPERHTLFVMPLGRFSQEQSSVVAAAADFIGRFYDLPVKLLAARPLVVPRNAAFVRQTPGSNKRQIQASYILRNILAPELPADAAALIAFTNEDLFPDTSMNYVFGQASFADRVGVWSLARLDTGAGEGTFLRRTLKIAAHETGHMFSIWHCTKYECVMSGTNHLEETDSRPLDACPECMAKIAWMSDVDPAARYKSLADFCRIHDLEPERSEFTRKTAALQ